MWTAVICILLGMVLAGPVAQAAESFLKAVPSTHTFYVDGQQVQMTAYNIQGSNYVRLRDIGQAVGFNVYFQNGVQVDSSAPYTGEAPDQGKTPVAASLQVTSYKGNTLKAGDRSMLLISPKGCICSVSSSNPSVVSVEQVAGQWVTIANASGTAMITITNNTGETVSLSLTVDAAEPVQVDLNANRDIRQEMICLINETRRINGVGELVINEALMNAAQECSTKMNKEHNTRYECETASAYGWPHGFGNNLTWFYGSEYMENVAQTAVNNWINSPGHFQTMVTARYQTIGVGVTIDKGKACCYMFAGDPNSVPAYS